MTTRHAITAGFVPLLDSALLVVAFFKVPLYSAPIWREIGRALVRPFV